MVSTPELVNFVVDNHENKSLVLELPHSSRTMFYVPTPIAVGNIIHLIQEEVAESANVVVYSRGMYLLIHFTTLLKIEKQNLLWQSCQLLVADLTVITAIQ